MRLRISGKPLYVAVALSTRVKLTLLVGAGCVLFNSGSYALGLGEMDAETYLGQHLEASIHLVDGSRRYQSSELSVRQILGKEAQSLGIELVNSRYLFVLELTGEGEELGLRVRSRRPITEPYVNLLVGLEWASGSVFREYTLFLDPPPAIAENLSAQSSRERPRRSELRAEEGARPLAGGRDLATLSATISPSSGLSSTHYRIRSGDTLSKIAEKWRLGTGETIRSTSRWLFENNPDSFSGDSEHLLIAGSELRFPLASELPLKVQIPSGLPALGREAESVASSPVGVAEGRLRLAEGVVVPLVNLDTASRAQLNAGLDSNRELIDRLRRENEDLRSRLNKLEGSDYVQMLTRLIELQNLQIDRLREEGLVAPNGSAQRLVPLVSSVERPQLGVVGSSGFASQPFVATALAQGTTSSAAVLPAAVSIGSLAAASLSQASGRPQGVAVRSWWQTVTLLGLPLLAVGLYLWACFRVRPAVLEERDEPLVDVGHWQPVVTSEAQDWPESLPGNPSSVGEVGGFDGVAASAEVLSKPLLLLDVELDEALDREFEALVEAADFDPASEFPDSDEAFVSVLASSGVSQDLSADELSETDLSGGGSLESQDLQAAIAAAACDSGALGAAVGRSPFNDSFEGLDSIGGPEFDGHDLDRLQGIDQNFGVNETENCAANISSLDEPLFELSDDQQAEFEEDWLDESSQLKSSGLALTEASAEIIDDVDSVAKDSPSLNRRREDVSEVLAGVANVLPFQRRRSDAELRQSIQVKTSDYTPPEEAYVVCDADDEAVLSLDFNLIDDPEFSEKGLNVEGFVGVAKVGGGASDALLASEGVSADAADMQGDGVRDGVSNECVVGKASQSLFVDLQFRAPCSGDGSPEDSPR